jgi:hypothetical protein
MQLERCVQIVDFVSQNAVKKLQNLKICKNSMKKQQGTEDELEKRYLQNAQNVLNIFYVYFLAVS